MRPFGDGLVKLQSAWEAGRNQFSRRRRKIKFPLHSSTPTTSDIVSREQISRTWVKAVKSQKLDTLFKDGRPGNDICRNFEKRHPELGAKGPKAKVAKRGEGQEEGQLRMEEGQSGEELDQEEQDQEGHVSIIEERTAMLAPSLKIHGVRVQE